MRLSYSFPGWCAVCRRGAVGVLIAGSLVAAAGPNRFGLAAPAAVEQAVAPVGTGLLQPGRTLQNPVQQHRSLEILQAREKAQATGPSAVPAPSTANLPPSGGGTGGTVQVLGGTSPLSAPQAVSVAITYALAQVGKPYVWGATGPDTYDCSGLVQRSYAMAGVALPRTSREQARVGTPVDLANLLPGDLLFWAYNPADLSTVHHVAMYLGNGKIVQAPQPGEFVEVTPLWLSGFAGAVRVASGPADAALPAVPAGVPGNGLTPAGDAMPDGSPPPDVGRTPSGNSGPGSTNSGSGSTNSGSSAPGTTGPGTTAPGTTAPGTTAPGTTAPGTTAPGTTAPGTTAPGTTAPGTTAPGTTAPGTISPGTNAPGTTAAGTTTPAPAPPTSAAAPPSTSPPVPPTTPPPPPASTTPASPSAAASTAAASTAAASTPAATPSASATP